MLSDIRTTATRSGRMKGQDRGGVPSVFTPVFYTSLSHDTDLYSKKYQGAELAYPGLYTTGAARH